MKIYKTTILFGCLLFAACNSNYTKNNLQQKIMERKIEANKQLVRLWLEEGWNKNRNQEVVAQVFSNDWVTTSHALEKRPKGIEGAMYWVNEFKKIFSETHFTITHLIADTNFVTARFEVTATQTGEFMGIKPTNKKIKYSGMVIHEITNGRISKTWTEFDLFGMKTQLEK